MIYSLSNPAQKLSKDKVKFWLASYMFKDEEDRNDKADKIANWLGTFGNHLTHGRPISIRDAQLQGLKVTKETVNRNGDVVLVKASNGMKFFEICQKL